MGPDKGARLKRLAISVFGASFSDVRALLAGDRARHHACVAHKRAEMIQINAPLGLSTTRRQRPIQPWKSLVAWAHRSGRPSARIHSM
jgi:hypothetical protein